MKTAQKKPALCAVKEYGHVSGISKEVLFHAENMASIWPWGKGLIAIKQLTWPKASLGIVLGG